MSLKLEFLASNNATKYETLIIGLHLALDADAKTIRIFIDSQLVTNQLTSVYGEKGIIIVKYMKKLRA